MGDAQAWDERLGDPGGVRDRYRVENYRIGAQDRLGFGGAKAKYADNIAAIRVLQELHRQQAQAASADEKRTLVRYVGWGGLPQAFDAQNATWASEYRELKALLSPDDYAKARRSTQDAHFTSETVIRGIYQGLDRIGVRPGPGTPLSVLEPSAGTGNFLGLCPERLQAHFLAVEMDPTSSAICRYLYPLDRHRNSGFQDMPDASLQFDAVVGNPPFGKQGVYDPGFTKLRGFSIHNYFLAKSISLLREGGVAAFVVSRFFLDAKDTSAREHIAEYADFLGAVRLPETAFRQNALTDVTTDIVFFQKNSGEKLRNRDWIQTGSVEVEDLRYGGKREATVNQFYIDRPGQVIGRMVYTSGMFDDALTCVSDADADLGQEISARLTVLPAVYVPADRETESASGAGGKEGPGRNEQFINSDYFRSLKTGSFCVEPESRKIVFKHFDAYGEAGYRLAPVKTEAGRHRLSGMIKVRDALRELINAEKRDSEEEGLVRNCEGNSTSCMTLLSANTATSAHK
jgi:hypothetical protein